MSTTRQLPMLTPWRTIHRMWVHFATKWELPTKVEAAYTRGVKVGEHIAEEKMRAWYRASFEAGYKQASEDLPICKVQPAPLLSARQVAALHKQRLIAAPSTYEPPEKRTDPLPTRHQPEDPDDTEEYKALTQLRHEGRGKAS